MHTNHDLETIDLALLANINGGAGGWRQDFKDWYRNFRDTVETAKTELHDAGDAFRRGEYQEGLRRTGAAVGRVADEIGFRPPNVLKKSGNP